jgi:hypothetical protein
MKDESRSIPRLNREWHLAHLMPKNATLEQRIEWHAEHSQNCSCREMPPSIAAEIEKRGLLKGKKAAPTTKTSRTQKFKAELQSAGGGGVFVCVPFDVQEVFGTRARVPVKATIDGEPYCGSLAPMGGGHMMGVLKAIREKIGKQVGDTVHIVLEQDTEERTVEVPADLQKALNKNKTAKTFFEKLAYTHRKEYVKWIEEAKKEETRARRIEKTIEMLEEGKKEMS